MTNDEAQAKANEWAGEAGGKLCPQLTENELAAIVNEAIAVKQSIRPLLVERLHNCAQGLSLGADGMGWSPDPALLKEAAAEIAALREQLARFTPLRARGVVDADDNLDCWDTDPFEICHDHVAALNEKDPAAMWRVVELFWRDLGPNAAVKGDQT